jgi:uncharacterized protein YmfQ (DUF2313 family)
MTAAEYLAQLKALLPPGRALVAAPGSNLEAVLGALAEEMGRLETRADELRLREADPRSAVELLTEWEATVGLPDACSPAAPSLSQRQQAVHTRLTEDGDVSEAAWIARAAKLGHAITVTETFPSRAGRMQSGDQLAPEGAVFSLLITAPTVLTHPFLAGDAQAGDPLGSFNSARLVCELNRVRPAHTRLNFDFTI